MCYIGYTANGIESHVGHVGIIHRKIIDVLPYDMLKMLKALHENEKREKEKDDEQKDDLKVLHERKEDAIYDSKKKEDDLGYGLFD